MRVRYTRRALSDLRAIHAHIAAEDPRAAQRVVATIARSAELIGRDPGRGHKTNEPDVQRVPVVRYRYAIYFRVFGDEVIIVHVRHSARRSPTAGEL